jgi:hypothetical protein
VAAAEISRAAVYKIDKNLANLPCEIWLKPLFQLFFTIRWLKPTAMNVRSTNQLIAARFSVRRLYKAAAL